MRYQEFTVPIFDSVLQIRSGNRDHSQITFIFLHIFHISVVKPSLELSLTDGSKEGSEYVVIKK